MSGDGPTTGDTGRDRDPDSFSEDEINAAMESLEHEFSGIDSFDDELEGLLGNKAKCALIITPLGSVELLAAFCQLSDISAQCVGDHEGGVVAVLRNLEGDGPEAAARDLTTVVSGLTTILAVNRANKVELRLWAGGKAGEQLPPPVVFESTPEFVEDMLIGSLDVDRMKAEGYSVSDSGDLSQQDALAIIARHTRFGRGGTTKGATVG